MSNTPNTKMTNNKTIYKMKYLYAPLFLVLCYSSNAQRSSFDVYQENITTSEETADSILSIYDLLNPFMDIDKPEKYISTINNTIGKKYPLIADFVNDVRIQQDTTDIVQKANLVLESDYPVILKDFITISLLSRRISKGEKDINLEDHLKYAYTSRKELTLKKMYDLILCTQKNDFAGVKTYAYEAIELLEPDLYPNLQIMILTDVTETNRNRLDSTDMALIEEKVKMGEELGFWEPVRYLLNIQMMYYKYRGEGKKAMEYEQRGFDASVLLKDTTGMITATNNLATFHQENGQFETAYTMIDEAKQYALASNDSMSLLSCDASIGFAKMNEKKYSDAIQHLKKSLENPKIFPVSRQVLSLVNMIDSYYMLDNLDSAYYYFEQMVELDPENMIGAHDYAKGIIASHLIRNGELYKAEMFIADAKVAAEQYNDILLNSRLLKAESDLLEAKGRYKEALSKYKNHMEIEQDFRNEDRAAEVTRTKLNFDFQKEKEIIALQNEQEKALLKEKQLRTALGGGLAGLALLLSLLFYRSLRKKTTEIENQKAELETLNNTKDTLFQIIGHDLKKPTIGFRNVSKNINYLVDKGDYDRLKKLGEEVDQDAKSLYNLTDNLLAWALVQKDAINLKPTNVNASEVTKDNIDLFTGIANRKNISLVNNVEDSCLVNADRNAMDTIIRNLLDNAIKFTPNGGTITIRNKEMDGVQSIYIEDTGIGLSKEAIQTIQNDAPISSTPGTDGEKGSGVGLQLVKSLVEKSNGKFSIANRSEKGVMISINLPKAI